MRAEVKGSRKYDATFRKQQAMATRSRILDAARGLLARGTYSTVTMADIAAEAGVAYQTVYAVFGNKVRLADALVEAGFAHIPMALKMFDDMFESSEPADWFRTASRANRLILEPCSDLARFIRESGDPALLSGYRKRERMRYVAIAKSGVVERLVARSLLRPGMSASEALGVIWAMTAADLYNQLVFDQGWSPDRYEEWLGQALMGLVMRTSTPKGT
jgi:AcrR family transcriptional regulator